MKKVMVLAASVCAMAAMAQAGEEAGRAEYMAACAGCHGDAAKGDGPLAEVLNIHTPDLTRMSTDNDGAFPYAQAFLTIDGRGGVRAHGSEMPVWGARFNAAALIEEYPETAEYIARGRVLSLVDYLVSIQE